MIFHIDPFEGTHLRECRRTDLRIYTFESGNLLKYGETVGLTVSHLFCDVPLLKSSMWTVRNLPTFAQERRTEQSETRFLPRTEILPTWHACFKKGFRSMAFSCRCGLFWYLVRLTSCAPNSWRIESRPIPIRGLTDYRPFEGVTHDDLAFLGLIPIDQLNPIGS